MQTAPKIHASTQKFTEIKKIHEHIVVFENNDACLIIEVSAVNFALLSKEEQDAKVKAYAGLLNSLSFPIQILIRSKKVEIVPYLKHLAEEEKKTTNDKLAINIKQYRAFIENLIKESSILDKQFYAVIFYSPLEAVAHAAVNTMGLKKASSEESFFQAKTSLETKGDLLLTQISHLSLRAHILEETELQRFFYDVYNVEASLGNNHEAFSQSLIVSGGKSA